MIFQVTTEFKHLFLFISIHSNSHLLSKDTYDKLQLKSTGIIFLNQGSTEIFISLSGRVTLAQH